jgi:hypothetical protein
MSGGAVLEYYFHPHLVVVVRRHQALRELIARRQLTVQPCTISRAI